MIAISAYYNFFQDENIKKNYLKFSKMLDLELLTVECTTPGHSPQLNLPNTLHVEGDILWQKEKLWMVGAKEAIKRGHDKVVWLDGDVIFYERDWIEKTDKLLNDKLVIQPFSRSIRHFSDRKVKRLSSLFVKRLVRATGGLALAARKEWIENVGLPIYTVTGGGDDIIISGILDILSESCPRFTRMSPKTREYITEWRKQCREYTGDDYGYVENVTLISLLHGSLASRRYAGRHDYLYLFNPDMVVDNGAWKWSDEVDETFKSNLYDYFKGRAN